MLTIMGSTTVRAKSAATAASTALPPAASISTPAADPSGWLVATMPRAPEAGRFSVSKAVPARVRHLEIIRWYARRGSPCVSVPLELRCVLAPSMTAPPVGRCRALRSSIVSGGIAIRDVGPVGAISRQALRAGRYRQRHGVVEHPLLRGLAVLLGPVPERLVGRGLDARQGQLVLLSSHPVRPLKFSKGGLSRHERTAKPVSLANHPRQCPIGIVRHFL